MRTASILIRTLNEERTLGATLDAVFAQSLPAHQVFIIDSASRDRTLEVAERFPVTIIGMSRKGWSYPLALNVGAKAATSEFLVCLSAHSPPIHEDWLGNLLRHFDDASVAAVWGPSFARRSTTPETTEPVRQEPGTYTYETRGWGMDNCNSALRRSLWLDFPFDERLPATEDKAWGMEAMARGYSLIFDPMAAVWHDRHRPTHSFRRSKAVMAGYRMLFPDEDHSMREELRKVSGVIGRELIATVKSRDWRKVSAGSRQLVSVAMAMLGKSLARRP